MLLFIGQSAHQIDEKGRIRIPSRFKDGLGANPFITFGSNHSLLVYSYEDAHKTFINRFVNNDFADDVMSMAIRVLMPNAFFAEEDGQGRILLPSHLVKHAQINKNIVTIGAFDHVEIWSEENWTSYNQSIDFDSVLKMIKKQDFTKQ